MPLAPPMSKPIPMEMSHSEPNEALAPLAGAAAADTPFMAPPQAFTGGARETGFSGARAKPNPGCANPNPGACACGTRWFASGGRPAGTGGGPLGIGGTNPALKPAMGIAATGTRASADIEPVPNANSGLGYALAADDADIATGIAGALVPNIIPETTATLSA